MSEIQKMLVRRRILLLKTVFLALHITVANRRSLRKPAKPIVRTNLIKLPQINKKKKFFANSVCWLLPAVVYYSEINRRKPMFCNYEGGSVSGFYLSCLFLSYKPVKHVFYQCDKRLVGRQFCINLSWIIRPAGIYNPINLHLEFNFTFEISSR